MCITGAIIGSALIGAGTAKYQGDKQRELAEKQAEEAKRRRLAEKAQFDREQKAAQATPTLLRNAAQQNASKGMGALSVKKTDKKNSLASLGTGGAPATGLNIPKG